MRPRMCEYHRCFQCDCGALRDDTPNPVIAIAGVSAFLAILWGGFGYIIGALVGFPS